MTKRIKCLVWDLDDTLWEGILLEGGGKKLRRGVLATLEELDRRGILLSIASKNDHDAAWANLQALDVDRYFLHPQISWNPKSTAVANVARSLNIGIDALAFIDDQKFERDEVAALNPDVVCYDANDIETLVDLAELNPPIVTADASRRREMYRAAMQRDEVEQAFQGTPDDFLRTLQMSLTIRPAQPEDLDRAEELTVRTHQLNSTGVTYSRAQLEELIHDPGHVLLVCELEDKYGTYGTIGLCLLKVDDTQMRILLLLMSCRVMSRGTGSHVLRYLQRATYASRRSLTADFVHNDRNRIMFVTYRFADFEEESTTADRTVLTWAGERAPDIPDYLSLHSPTQWWLDAGLDAREKAPAL